MDKGLCPAKGCKMNKNVILGLSVVTAVLISTGCSSDGGDTTTGDSSLPSWTGSKVDMNVTSAAVAISEFRKGMETPASPVRVGIPYTPVSDASQFEQKSAIAVAALDVKRAPVGREKSPSVHRSANKKTVLVGPGPESDAGEHNCTVFGNITITYDSGDWGEEGGFNSRTEVHNNCLDNGDTLDEYSQCAFFPPLEGGSFGVSTTGSCESFDRGDDNHYEGSDSYTAYKEVWTDSENDDVFTYTVDVEDKNTYVYSDDGSVESGTYTYTSNGHFDLHGEQGEGDAWIKVRNEAKSFNVTGKYDDNISSGKTIREDGAINGYFGTSLIGADNEGTARPSSGYGYYFSNLITEDNYVDENISHFSFGGTFGSACMNGNVVFETTKVLVDDANFRTCEGDDEPMPKDGNVTITGNGMATAMFFEAGEYNSDLNISSGSDSEVYDCWEDLEQCGESERK